MIHLIGPWNYLWSSTFQSINNLFDVKIVLFDLKPRNKNKKNFVSIFIAILIVVLVVKDDGSLGPVHSYGRLLTSDQ